MLAVPKTSVLLVDDDEDLLASLERALRAQDPAADYYRAGSVEGALLVQSRVRPEVAIVDLYMSRHGGVNDGFDLIRNLRERDSSLRIIVLTGHSSFANGVRAMTLGAASLLEKPVDVPHLAALIRDGAQQAGMRRELDALRRSERAQSIEGLVGSSDKIQGLLEEIKFAASSNQPVLISGETGCGKGVVAKAIHALSGRAAKQFVRYQANFAGADLVNSDLFGHSRGAFTGALSERIGLLDEANFGTLFLDEIDELPTEVQITLLGVLQEKVFRPLGSSKERRSDFRLICATNRDLEECLRSDKLRADFYHRIAHLVIRVPPLRQHPEDIEELARYFLAQLRARDDVRVYDIAEDALLRLKRDPWPGNVRELQAALEGAAYRAQFNERSIIFSADLGKISNNGAPTAARERDGFHEQVAKFKISLAEEALSNSQGNQVQAAKSLGIDRSSLRRILDGVVPRPIANR